MATLVEHDPSTPSTTQRRGVTASLLKLAASIHVAWFYVALVPSALDLVRYEQGLERSPFQERALMMLPLRLAHGSNLLNHVAQRLEAMPAWFPGGVRPEGIVEAAIDLACIVATGLVAERIYEAASQRKMLSGYVYPFTLVMIVATFCLNTMHRFRFVFDLPSMGLFSLGLYVIYFKRSQLLFAALFLAATVNRETSLFLLLFYVLKQLADALTYGFGWRKVFKVQSVVLTTLLVGSWVAWHVVVDRHFHANPTAAGPRFWLNVGTLLWPTSWAQVLCAFAFCAPLCIGGRYLVADRTLRLWFWALPVWFLFMMRFGILIEIRVFGELIPFFACVAVLIAEERLMERLGLAPYRAA